MKLISFRRAGRDGFGAVVNDQVVDLTGAIAGIGSVIELLAAGKVAEAGRHAATAKPAFALSDCTLLPPVPNPSKIVCVGVNYVDHASEAGRKVGDHPVIFHRFAETLVAPGEPLIRPKVSQAFDYEGELAVVMGRGGMHIAESDAMAYVAGYTCFNDASIRDWQFHTHQYGMGKNFQGSGPLGPWLVTVDEIPDYRKMELRTVVSGEELQHGRLDQLAFDIPRLISYVSKALPWKAGDVLATGTPAGVGFVRKPPRFLVPGDVVEVTITGVGTLRNSVRDE
uniref:Fumarylacetoacetase-like C-terminal domain-containing protein n=1 Tax=uncultured bacterium 1114 TaxID=548901 RepID=B8R941_9BACT|nr:hypothetical protein [uncultured bacterium 1114]